MKVARVLLPSFLLAAIVILVYGRHALLPRAQTVDETGTPCCQADQTAPREVDFPYYSLRDGFNSNLLLVGASPKPTDFVVAVRGLLGQTVLLPAMTIESGEKRSIDLRAALTEMGADVNGDFAEGSVAVYFNGTVMPLPGQLTVSNPARSLSLESEMVDNSPGLGLLPATLNALWWGLGGGRDARIMVSNTSGDSVTADVFLDFQGERHASTPLSFVPHETKVLSVSQLLGELKVSPAQAPEGGITIIQRSPKPTLIAQGKITDPATGFSTSLNFMDPSLQKASALHASGVPIGLPSPDSPYAGTGVFIPHVIVRNLTGSTQNVAVTLEYPGEKEPQQTPLAPLTVGPYATVDVALDSAFAMLPLPLPYCSIRIQYSGPPGSVIGEVSSIESKGDLVIDSRVANEGNGWAGSGGHPWHLDDETESIMFLTNMGDRPARIGFDVVAGGTHYYLTKLKLQPHETQAIDLRRLRDEQKPDFQGTKLPAAATDGSVIWSRLDHVPVMGRLLVLQRHKGVSSNYDCEICDCPADYVGLEVDPDTATIVVGGTAYLVADAIFRDHCNAWDWPYRVLPYWNSLSPSIATVDVVGVVRGVAGGTASIKAIFADYYYTYDSHGGVCVEHPRSKYAYATVNVKPSITSLSPTRGLIGVTTSVTVNGNGFGTNPTVNAGTGITVTRGSFSDTQIQASFAVASNAPSGNHSVTVSTAQGTSNSVNFYVQVPTSLSIVPGTDSTTSEAPCTTGGGDPGCGVTRTFRYQVKDQSGQPIAAGGMQFGDFICNTSTNQLNLVSYRTTCGGTTGGCSGTTGPCGQSTDSNGQFLETLTICAPACKSSGVCVTAGQTLANQTWTVAGYTLNSDVKSLSYQCNRILVNGN